MEEELARMRREKAQGSPGDYTIQGLQWRLEHLRRVKERCYCFNGRCLRFWQFKARERGGSLPLRDRKALPMDWPDMKIMVELAPEGTPMARTED